MRKRIIISLTAAAMLLGVGGFAVAQASTQDRGWCIQNGTGNPANLWLDKDGNCPKGWWGPTSMDAAADASIVTLQAEVKALTDRVNALEDAGTPVKVVAPSDEAAPALSANGSPSLTDIPVKWTKADPPGNDTVVGYQIRFRKTSVASWTTNAPLANVLYTTVAVPFSGTQYFVQVRAQYNTTDGFGPWSNTLTATTDIP